MLRLLGLALGGCLAVTSTVQAGERYRVGHGLVFTNDIIGDGNDRWRTGSVASSHVYAPGWDGAAPARLGEMLELRFNGEIIAPEDISTPAPGDRPYAGALSLGLHSHVTRGRMEYALGGDLVVTGSQTGLDDFQGFLHDIVGNDNMSAGVRRNQVGNEVHPTGVIEAGRSFTLGPVRLRPFAEARAGVETLVRAGADLTLGGLTQGELMVREPVTGQRYRAVRADVSGYAIVLGADITYVEDSKFLPGRSGVQIEETRTRVRGGLHWEGRGGGSVFYGVTYLGEEFKSQREGQVVGSLQFRLRF